MHKIGNLTVSSVLGPRNVLRNQLEFTTSTKNCKKSVPLGSGFVLVCWIVSIFQNVEYLI